MSAVGTLVPDPPSPFIVGEGEINRKIAPASPTEKRNAVINIDNNIKFFILVLD